MAGNMEFVCITKTLSLSKIESVSPWAQKRPNCPFLSSNRTQKATVHTSTTQKQRKMNKFKNDDFAVYKNVSDLDL